MKNNKPDIPKEIKENMEVLQVIIYNENDKIGILVMAQDYFEGSPNPLLRIYMMHKVEDEYVIQTELEAFQFSDYELAKDFNDRLPNMTALEILLVMNGQGGTGFTEVSKIIQ